MHAAGQVAVVPGHGDEIAHVDVLRAGDDLHRLCAAVVDHADPHVVGVFMPGHRQDLAHDDVLDFRVHPGDGLDLLARQGQDVGIFFVCGFNLHKFF